MHRFAACDCQSFIRARNADVVVKTAHPGYAHGFKDVDAVRTEREAATQFLDAQWEARKKFWATVEAIDTYMRVFTDGLVKNPNDIREIKSMLDEVEIIKLEKIL